MVYTDQLMQISHWISQNNTWWNYEQVWSFKNSIMTMAKCVRKQNSYCRDECQHKTVLMFWVLINTIALIVTQSFNGSIRLLLLDHSFISVHSINNCNLLSVLVVVVPAVSVSLSQYQWGYLVWFWSTWWHGPYWTEWWSILSLHCHRSHNSISHNT